MAQGLVEIAYVAKAHGVRGELRVICHNPESRLLLDVSRIILGRAGSSIAGEAFAVDSVRRAGTAYIVRLVGLTCRDRAESLRGTVVLVERDVVPVEQGEVLLADLIGLAVELRDGSPWGSIVAIESGPQERLVVHDRDKDCERLLPLVDALVVDIDVAAGRVVVDPPDDWPEAPISRVPPGTRGPRD